MSLGFLLLVLYSCSSGGEANPLTQTNEVAKYKMNIYADSAVSSLLEQQVEIFEKEVPQLDIITSYHNGEQVSRGFLEGKYCDVWLTTQYTDEQLAKMQKSGNYYPYQYPIANTAMALIVHKENAMEKISIEEFKHVVETGLSDKVKAIVVEDGEGALLRNILQNLLIAKPSDKMYSLNSYNEVIDYVIQNKESIGIINFAHLSNQYSDRVKGILEKVKVLPIEMKDSLNRPFLTMASQGDIANHTYPLLSRIGYASCMDTLEYKRLWINWLHSAKSSRITLKAGLIPERMPERNILVNKDSIPLPPNK